MTPDDKYLTANGLRLHYLDWGNEGKRPLVLLHGFGSQAHAFDDFARLMAPDYRVLSLDLRGFGDSEWPQRDGYGHRQMAEDVDALIGALGLTDVALLGQSLGGLVAMTYMLRPRPEVTALVIVDIGPDIDPAGQKGFRAYLAALPDSFESPEQAIQWSMSARPGRAREVARKDIDHNLRPRPGGGWTWKFDSRFRGPDALKDWPTPPDLWPALERLPVPALVVRGERSEYLSAQVAEKMRRVTPRCRLETVRGVGHSIHRDAPSELARLVGEFLKSPQ